MSCIYLHFLSSKGHADFKYTRTVQFLVLKSFDFVSLDSSSPYLFIFQAKYNIPKTQK